MYLSVYLTNYKSSLGYTDTIYNIHRWILPFSGNCSPAFFNYHLIRNLLALSAGAPVFDNVGKLTARINTENLVSLYIVYICDNVLPPSSVLFDFSYDVRRSKNCDVVDETGGNLTRLVLFSSGSDRIIWELTPYEGQAR